ncbi:MAG: dUTP diphosphatase [Epsilonproteobacteria bacterium]|nr:dUTP diphosphatase [Campylobacterota bacterium]
MGKLLSMLQLQQQLNDSTNGLGWEKGVTQEGKRINWRRCIYMESAEMIDSFGWKHWKSITQPTDYANLQIEIVDVWHSTPVFASDEALMLKIETIMRRSLEPAVNGDLEKMVDDFFRLSVMGALNLDELYRLYVGKNILNQFRQDHGYKEGSYIKIWNGMEDNAVMKRGWEENPDMSPKELYEELSKAYPV